ncbi:MAG: AAA family ATPase [Devosiaceae bacterium]
MTAIHSPQGSWPAYTQGSSELPTMTHVVGDQSAVMRFMHDPASHGLPPGTPTDSIVQIDTHGAAVFLVGDKAYKIKRAVCFPFMDFSTLAHREEACRAEIAINRPNAPEIYIDAVAITRDRTGHLAINGRGEPIEWAVAMRRFDRDMTFDRLAERDLLTEDDLDGAIDALIAFQSRAPVRRADDWVSDLGAYIQQNDQAFHESPRLFALHDTAQLTQRTKDELQRVKPVLNARGEGKFVRRCHGDLHLRNLVRLPQGVRMFDAVEFDERIATGDVLYDFAFLVMDLDSIGHRGQANRLLSRYLALRDAPEDLDALAAMPLFLSMRAALRAKVSAMAAPHLAPKDRQKAEADAKRFYAYANDVLEPRDVTLTVVGGLSGTGKSTVAKALAPSIGRATGAIILRSDIVRKSEFGVPWNDSLPPSAYTPAVSKRVFSALRQQAQQALVAGHSVVVDAVCAKQEEREAFEMLARGVECHFAGVWLDAPLATRVARIGSREGDPSDANADVARVQEGYDLLDIEWPRVDATGPLEDVLAAVRPRVDRLN